MTCLLFTLLLALSFLSVFFFGWPSARQAEQVGLRLWHPSYLVSRVPRLLQT